MVGNYINEHLFLTFPIKKELTASNRCVEMVVPWQLCRTIGSLTLHSQEKIIFFQTLE